MIDFQLITVCAQQLTQSKQEKKRWSQPVTARCNTFAVRGAANLKLVEDYVRCIEIVEHRPQIVVKRHGLHWARLHVDVPNLDGQVITGHDVSPISGVAACVWLAKVQAP